MDADCAGARGDVASQITFSREEFATIIATALVQTAGRLPITIELWWRLKECGISRPEHELPSWASFLSDPGAAKERGNRLYAEARYDDAAACFSHGLSLCRTEDARAAATLYQNRAATYEKLGEHLKVVHDCTSALSHWPHYPKALARRARSLLTLGRPDEALRDALASSSMDGCSSKETLDLAVSALSLISLAKAQEYSKESRGPQPPSPQLVRRYIQSFSNDPLLNDVTNGHSIGGSLSKALQDIRSEKYDNVIADCTAEAETGLSSNLVLALLLRATFKLLLGNLEEAEADLDLVIKSSETSSQVKSNALIKKACIYFQRQQTDDALEYLDDAEKAWPENGDVFYHRGMIKLVMDKIAEAAEAFERCRLLSPDFVDAALQKGYCEYRLRRDRSASSDQVASEDCLQPLRDVTTLYPDACDGHVLFGQALQDSHFYDEAEVAFNRARAADPSDAAVLVHLALLHESQRSDGNSEALLHEAIALDNRCELAYENLAAIEFKRGDTEAAVKHLEKLLPLAKGERELAHVFSLIEASDAQLYVKDAYGISAPFLAGL